MNGDRDGDGVGTRTGVEASERTQEGNGDGAGTGTGTGVESRGRTQDGNEDGSGDGNESSSGDGDKDGIGAGGGEAKKLKKLHKNSKRDVGSGGDLSGKRKT